MVATNPANPVWLVQGAYWRTQTSLKSKRERLTLAQAQTLLVPLDSIRMHFEYDLECDSQYDQLRSDEEAN